MEGNLLYWKSTNLNVNLIQKTPSQNMQNNVSPTIYLCTVAQSS